MARQAPLPEAARKFYEPGMKVLVAFCRELQRAAEVTNGGTFYLGCRDAGQLLGVSHDTAARWLGLLQRAGVIVCVRKGSKGDKGFLRAAEYRYLGGD